MMKDDRSYRKAVEKQRPHTSEPAYRKE